MAEEVLIRSFPDLPLAEFWQKILLDNGIRSMIKPLGAGYGIWGQSSWMFHGLYVLDSNEAAAQALMGEEETLETLE